MFVSAPIPRHSFPSNRLADLPIPPNSPEINTCGQTPHFAVFCPRIPAVTAFRLNTYTSVSKHATLSPFRMNTYAKQGGGWSHSLVHTKSPASRPSNSNRIIFLRTLCTIQPRKFSPNSNNFMHFRTLAQINRGVAPSAHSPRKFSRFVRTYTSGALHLASLGGTISGAVCISIRGTIPLTPVSKFQERTKGSPLPRAIFGEGPRRQARDRRPGPLAIRRRNPASSVNRPGKASSVRLGERSIVGP